MEKTEANRIAARLYRDFVTRGKSETTQRDYHAVVYTDIDCVVVTYCVNDETGDCRQHACKIRKAWMY